MSKSDDMSQMYQEGVKPQYPDSEGMQYADSPSAAFNGQSNKLGVTYNQDLSEIAEDRTFHANTTPEQGGWNWNGNQYNTDFGGGESKSYGQMVTDNGRNPQVDRTSVNVANADRGPES